MTNHMPTQKNTGGGRTHAPLDPSLGNTRRTMTKQTIREVQIRSWEGRAMC